MSTLKKAMMGQSSRCYKPSFIEIGSPVPEKILKGFYHIWAWWPSRPCDLDAANTFLSPIRKIEYELMGSYLKSTHIAAVAYLMLLNVTHMTALIPKH